MTIYNDYGITEDLDIEYENAIEDLEMLDTHEYYLAVAESVNRYFGNNAKGYKILKNLRDILKLAEDYTKIKYKDNSIEFHTCNHDWSTKAVIRPLNKKGLEYYNRHFEDMEEYDLAVKLENMTKRLV